MNESYRNKAQLRLCQMILLMAGKEFDGVQPSSLAKALNTNPSNVTRDLANLEEAGFAARIGDSDNWRLGPKVIQVAVNFAHAFQQSQERVLELKQRYTVER